jgi:hypothetical protein
MAVGLGSGLGGCGGDDAPTADQTAGMPPTAQPQLVAALRDDLSAPRSPSDGGGRAWLEESEALAERGGDESEALAERGGDESEALAERGGDESEALAERGGDESEGDTRAVAGKPGRWRFVYEAGPLGVAAGGAVFFQAPPFWGWSTPQVVDPDGPGYTEVSVDAEGVSIEPATIDQGLLAITIGGRALRAGERIRLVYGAGASGALADRYAERDSPFWFAVDGDGDGVRALVKDPPRIDVEPGPAARLVAHLPATAHPGDTVRLTLAVLDAVGNAGAPVDATVALSSEPPGLEVATDVRLEPADGGRRTVEARAPKAGVFRVVARVDASGEASPPLVAESNPLEISAAAPRILWADLHGHSSFSDGTGLPDDYLGYARDIAGLDVIALTDHDHWGMPFLDQDPERWQRIVSETRARHEPSRFVTLLGYEWTSWIYGHRHVLYFDDAGPLSSSIDTRYETPEQLWRALDGRDALTFAHHSAGGPIATDWSIPPDPRFEPVTEVVSVHGSSEAADSPSLIYRPVAGNFVRDALDRGYRLGFVGSGDSHDGHPGLAQLASPSGGLAAVFSETLTREGVLEALRARRAYATNGARIILRLRLGAAPMGATIAAGASGALVVRVEGTAPITALELIRSGTIVERQTPEERTATWELALAPLAAGEYVYVRVIQADGGLAWSSPIFAE